MTALRRKNIASYALDACLIIAPNGPFRAYDCVLRVQRTKTEASLAYNLTQMKLL